MIKNALLGALVLTVLLSLASAGCKAKTAPKPGDDEILEVDSPAAVPQPAAAANPAELFKQSCVRCHRIEKAVVYSGEIPWKELVARMIQHGAKITPENAAIIVKHLETTHPLKKTESL